MSLPFMRTAETVETGVQVCLKHIVFPLVVGGECSSLLEELLITFQVHVWSGRFIKSFTHTPVRGNACRTTVWWSIPYGGSEIDRADDFQCAYTGNLFAASLMLTHACLDN